MAPNDFPAAVHAKGTVKGLANVRRSHAFLGYVTSKRGKGNPSYKATECSAHISLPRDADHPKDGTQHAHRCDTETNGIGLEVIPPTPLFVFRLPLARMYINYSMGFNSCRRGYNPTVRYKHSHSSVPVPRGRERNQALGPR